MFGAGAGEGAPRVLRRHLNSPRLDAASASACARRPAPGGRTASAAPTADILGGSRSQVRAKVKHMTLVLGTAQKHAC